MAEHTGLVQVYTGDGKGKTTAAVGLCIRAVGRGLRVAFVQFVKGGERSGELEPLERLGVNVERPAAESTGLLGQGATDEDRRSSAVAFGMAREALLSGEYDLVVMDEVCVALAYDLVPIEPFLVALRQRPSGVEVVCTGRGAPEELVEYADLVTEVRLVKHPYQRGIPARPGIEY